MGSLAALEAAAKGGKRITQLALLGAAVPMPVSGRLLETASRQPDGACKMVTTWSHTPTFSVGRGWPRRLKAWQDTGGHASRNSGTLAGDLANCSNYQHGLAAAAWLPAQAC
ncbi:MAG: hypothetical protein IPO00_11465 [Betaproteobacteria bacterium]|nr:hypothetical protein [Betaproteobacteria bacterium]